MNAQRLSLHHEQSPKWRAVHRVTSDLVRRVYEHSNGIIAGFTKQYGLKRLVYYESYDDIRTAIQREKTMKHWSRAWKVRLINGFNREWDDLYNSIT